MKNTGGQAIQVAETALLTAGFIFWSEEWGKMFNFASKFILQ